jgi:hypothetical protein
MTPEQAIARLNASAQASHRAFLQACEKAETGRDPAAAAMLARYNAFLDAIEVVRKIYAEEHA